MENKYTSLFFIKVSMYDKLSLSSNKYNRVPSKVIIEKIEYRKNVKNLKESNKERKHRKDDVSKNSEID